jgi:hypothetical protein
MLDRQTGVRDKTDKLEFAVRTPEDETGRLAAPTVTTLIRYIFSASLLPNTITPQTISGGALFFRISSALNA